MTQLKPTLLQRGVSRLVGATPDRPFSLHNAEVVKATGVDAVALPTTVPDTGAGVGRLTTGPAPYHRTGDGVWFDGDDFDVTAGVGRKLVGHLDTAGTYRFGFVPEGTSTIEEQPAALLNVFVNSATQIADTGSALTYVEEGVPGLSSVSYIGIAHDRFGQAMCRKYWYVTTNGPDFGNGTDNGIGTGYAIEFWGVCSSTVAYVDVYRTKVGGKNGDLYGSNLNGGDPGYYYLGRFSPVVLAPPLALAGELVVKITDDKNWIDLASPSLDPETYSGDPVGPLMDEPLTTWAYRDIAVPFPDGTGDLALIGRIRHPHARCLFNHAGVLVHGDVSFPTGTPAFAHVYQEGGAGYPEIALQLEYTTPDGPAYGPAVELISARTVSILNSGEAALNVFVKDTGVYYLFERLTATETGYYATSYSAADDYGTGEVTFSGIVYNAKGKQTSVVGPYAETEYVDDPSAFLLSKVNRPLEMTFNGDSVPDGSRVVAIAGARLAEDEGLKAYDFYVFSERGSYVVSRTGTTVTLDALVAGVGAAFGVVGPVAESVPVESPQPGSYAAGGAPLVCSTPQGCAFVGTDNVLRLVSGRQSVDLAGEVPGLLGRPISLTYVHEGNRIAFATTTGTWLFDVDVQAWSVHIDRVPDEVLYDRFDRRLLFRDGVTVEEWDGVSGPRASDASVATQPAVGPEQIETAWLRADYDPRRVTHTATFNVGSNLFALDAIGIGLSIGDPLYVQGAGLSRSGTPTDLNVRVAAVSEAGGVTTVTGTTNARRTGTGTVTASLSASMAVRTDTTRPDPHEQTVPVGPGRPAWFTIRGIGHHVVVSGFRRLRSILDALTSTLDTD